MEGKSGAMGEHKNITCVDVTCISYQKDGALISYLYGITDAGVLLLFNQEKVLEKWVDLKMEYGKCITGSETMVICGGSHGVIRVFEPVTLKYLGTLPKPDPLYIKLEYFELI